MKTTTRPAAAGISKTDGLAPRGMIWVAWRQRCSLILITLGLYAAATVTLVVTRMIRAHQLAASGVADISRCQDTGMTAAMVGFCERWLDVRSSWSGTIGQLGAALPAICVLFGLGLGAAAVGHEFEKGVSSFSFTQSISPIRWAATQLGVIGITTAVGLLTLDLLGRIPQTARAIVGDDPGGPLGASVWTHTALILVTVGLGFGMSVLSGSASGGFWGGLGALVIGGLVAGILLRPTASGVSSVTVAVLCTGPADELCGRVSSVVVQFRAFGIGTAAEPNQSSTISLVVAGLAGLIVGFLVLRRRFC